MNDVIPSNPTYDNGISAEEEQRVVKALHDVIEVNVASRDALKGLAGDVEDLTIAATLRTIAGQRQRQANELQRFVDYERGDGENHLENTLEVLEQVVADDESTHARLIRELQQTEDRLASIYQAAVQTTEGLSINGVLQRHLRNTQTQVGRLRNLEARF
ncbi:MAG: hypothetical protein KC613_19525 [Myxococcales bacterium]|nr:hypothetical protein [Myxococcales bacterium]MCB9523637.1 hypothetical protein [Myxococcales bacterium]